MLYLNILSFVLVLFSYNEVSGGTRELRGLGLLPQECGFIAEERVSNSKYAKLYEFPWTALIFTFGNDGARKLKCSGTVINELYVLTTAHCAGNPRSLQVRVGDYDHQQDVDCESQGETRVCEDQFQEIDVEEKIVHEDYSFSIDSSTDIALLRLKTPIDFSQKNAAPVCLPTTPALQQKALQGKEGIIAGWELNPIDNTSSKLLKIKVPVKNNVECSEHLIKNAKEGLEGRNNNKICTGGVDGVCPLISGSPLMLPCAVEDNVFRYIQYGFVYSGMNMCSADTLTFYVDVTKYMEWILNNLKN